MRKTLFLLLAFIMAALPLSMNAELKTWTFEWNKSHSDNTSQGFYNFGTNYVEKDVYTTELNTLTWSIASTGTHKYAYTAKSGQTIGTSLEPSTHTSLWTESLAGKVRAVRVQTRTNKNENQADLSVTVNGVKYQCNGTDKAAMTATLADYEFKSASEAAAAEGKIEISIDPTSEAKGTLYIKKIEIDYEVAASSVAVPTFNPAAGTYDSAQQVTIAAGQGLSVYYTTDNSNPRLDGGTRKLYSAPVVIDTTTTLKAVAYNGTDYSDIAQAQYVIRKSPELRFYVDSLSLLSGKDGYADLINPHKVEPVTYTSSDWQVCSVDEMGMLYSSYVTEQKTVTITARFAGNETYLPGVATMRVTVVPNPPLATPQVSPAGGTYNDSVEVTITSTDERSVTIWYSTTAKSEEEFESDYTKSTVVEGKEAKFTIDKSCTLYVMTRGYNVNSPVMKYQFTINTPLKADFATDRSYITRYAQNFDNTDSLKQWTVGSGWKLADNKFSTIDPTDKLSIAVGYNDGTGSTTLTSPEFTVEPNSEVSFYARFSAVFLVYGSWQFNVVNTATGETTQLLDAFNWAQDNNYTGPKWNRFEYNLKQFEGQKVKFQFNYNYGGEDLALDNFALKVLDEQSAEAIHIFEGDSITFISTSLGDPDSLQWTLDGATPPTSTLKTVTATYAHSGSYDVTLTVKRGTESNTITRKAYVVVSQQAPTAIIGLPEEGYESPFVGVFVPVNVPVTFRDLSTGNPTEWKWVFQNTDITSSTEQNPTITYLDKGRFSVGLTAKNAAGQSNDVLTYAVQAGGAQYVWNISTEENTNLSKIALGWYGNYAGSNWLGMRRFAEQYKAPLADATIDSVAVYFASNTTVSPDSTIVLTVNAVDDKGNPGQILGTTSIKASQIKYSDDDYLATVFKLAQPVKLSKGQKFFVVVGPFPNATDEASYKTDDIAIFCLRRPVGGKCTTWHELEDQDENGRSLGTYSWLPNTDDPVSMAIAPVVTYDALSTAVTTVEQSNPSNSKIVAIYTLSGMQVDSMEPGHIYIVKRADGTASKVKIVK